MIQQRTQLLSQWGNYAYIYPQENNCIEREIVYVVRYQSELLKQLMFAAKKFLPKSNCNMADKFER